MAKTQAQGIAQCADFEYKDLIQGNSLFTLVRADGERFTFRIQRCELTDSYGRVIGSGFYAFVLAGPDNTRDYKRLGMFHPEDGVLEWVGSSQVRKTAPSFVTLRTFTEALKASGVAPEGWQVWLAGRCLRCGRTLTVPASVSMKYGPDCADYVILAGL